MIETEGQKDTNDIKSNVIDPLISLLDALKAIDKAAQPGATNLDRQITQSEELTRKKYTAAKQAFDEYEQLMDSETGRKELRRILRDKFSAASNRPRREIIEKLSNPNDIELALSKADTHLVGIEEVQQRKADRQQESAVLAGFPRRNRQA